MLEFTAQERLRYAYVYHVPRQDFIGAELAVSVKRRVDADRGKNIHPHIIVKEFVPAVETHAAASRLDKRGREPAVSAREHRLDKADLRLVPIIADRSSKTLRIITKQL